MPPTPPSASATARALAPDALKAAAIFGVVYIHSSAVFTPTDAIVVIVRTLRFSVPAFITVWAYYQERAYLRQPAWRATMPRRFLLVLVPFVVWTVFYSLLDPGRSSGGVLSYVSREWAGYGWSGQYFFLILLQLVVLFPVLRRFAIGRLLLVGIFAVYALGFSALNLASLPAWFVKLSYRPFVYWLPYVALGIYLARHRDERLPIAAGVVGVLLIVGEALFAWPHPRFDDDYAKPGMLIGMGLIAACLLNRPTTVRQDPSFLTRIVLLVGSSTMGIFLLNPLAVRVGAVFAAAIGWHEPSLTLASSAALSLGYAVVVLALCLAATLAFKRVGLGRLVS